MSRGKGNESIKPCFQTCSSYSASPQTSRNAAFVLWVCFLRAVLLPSNSRVTPLVTKGRFQMPVNYLLFCLVDYPAINFWVRVKKVVKLTKHSWLLTKFSHITNSLQHESVYHRHKTCRLPRKHAVQNLSQIPARQLVGYYVLEIKERDKTGERRLI